MPTESSIMMLSMYPAFDATQSIHTVRTYLLTHTVHTYIRTFQILYVLFHCDDAFIYDRPSWATYKSTSYLLRECLLCCRESRPSE